MPKWINKLVCGVFGHVNTMYTTKNVKYTANKGKLNKTSEIVKYCSDCGKILTWE